MANVIHETAIENAARAFYDRIFEEKWDDLHSDSIERALYLEATRAAIEAYEEPVVIGSKGLDAA